jgi:hypothetical protein
MSDQSGQKLDLAAILGYKDYLKGADNVLFVGAGPSGVDWERHCDKNTVVMTCNSAITGVGARADIFFTCEAGAYTMPWYYHGAGQLRFAARANLSHDPRCFHHQEKTVSIERSWHIAGFDPREYVNRLRLTKTQFLDPELPYNKHSNTGIDPWDYREYGLLKGPVCKDRFSIGTGCLQGLHLLGYFGCRKVRMIGFDLCWDDTQHWSEPDFQYQPSRWTPPDCFVEFAGHKTMWHFLLSAAFVCSLFPVFLCAGMEIENLGGGLLDEPGIETLLRYIGRDDPQNVLRGIGA